QWDELSGIADQLDQIAVLLRHSANVPKKYSKDTLAALLSSRVNDLRSAVKSKDPVVTDQLLQRIDYGIPLDTVPESDMIRLWVRFDHPVRVSLALSPAQAE